jgi:hypothetical protein
VVKWIFRCLRGTTDYGITFVRQKSDLLVVGYVDADYARDLDDRRLTTGYVFTLAGRPIYWRSMIQSTVAISMTEVEYMAMAEAAGSFVAQRVSQGVGYSVRWSSVTL